MLLNPILHPTVKPEHLAAVERGLANHSLFQDGGVIRRVGNKKIFAHLYQSAEFPERVASSVAQVSQGLLVATTALSAVNLGVSVAGFAILARKMERLHSGLRDLDQVVRQNHSELKSGIDRIEARVVALADLVASQGATRRREHETLSRQIDHTQLSGLLASAESLRDIEGGRRAGRTVGEHAERIRECRMYLVLEIGHYVDVARSASDADLLRGRALVLAWAQALIAEAQAWRLAGETQTAARVLNEGAPPLRDAARAIVLGLVHGDVSVFGAPEPRALLEASPLACAVPSLVLSNEAAPASAVRRLAADAWADKLTGSPSSARDVVASAASAEKTAARTQRLGYALAEAATVVSGLRAEIDELATRHLERDAWEEKQLRGDPPRLVLRLMETEEL